jgi:arabinan endo-1,5-alpha-L-arabinosidase
MIVGRSVDVKGLYIDKEGISMAKGGGTILLAGDKNWHGVGHCGVYNFNGKDFIIFHAYETADNGKLKLLIREITWDKNGWPVISL